MLHKIKINKEHLLIAFKLLIDALLIALAFFLLSLVAEGLIPGIITSYIGFSKIIVFIGLVIVAGYLISRSTGISFGRKPVDKKTASLMLFVLVLLVFNSLIKINIFLSLIVLSLTLISAYSIYRIIIEESDAG